MAKRERSLYDEPAPGLGALQPLAHSHSSEDPAQEPGSWKVVIHTIGLTHASGDLKEYLASVPGITRKPWASSIELTFQGSSAPISTRTFTWAVGRRSCYPTRMRLRSAGRRAELRPRDIMMGLTE